MSQERTEQKHFFETKEAVGTKIWALDSGIGEIIEMQAPYSYRMHNGVRWESDKIVDQYLDYGGVEGVSLKSIFPMEEAVHQLIGLLNQSRSETKAADRAAEMNMWMIDRLNATIAGQTEAIREQTAKVQERDAENERMRREQGLTVAQQFKEIERLREHEKAWKADHKADIEENSRLRAVLLNSRGDFIKIMELTVSGIAHNIARAAAIDINAALKGAE